MIWPFLMIYIKGQVNLPLSTVTILTTINATSGLIFSPDCRTNHRPPGSEMGAGFQSGREWPGISIHEPGQHTCLHLRY